MSRRCAPPQAGIKTAEADLALARMQVNKVKPLVKKISSANMNWNRPSIRSNQKRLRWHRLKPLW
jgi:hypothetical protein